MATAPSTLPSVERALKLSLSSASVLDVLLFAPSRRKTADDGRIRIEHALPVLAIGSVLKQYTYFDKLLNRSKPTVCSAVQPLPDPASDYAEEYDYESDSDLDEFEDDATRDAGASGTSELNASVAGTRPTADASPLGVETPQWKCQQVVLPTVAVRTLRACVFYLYTCKTRFLPLKSQGAEARNLELALALTDPSAPPPCSPKSMYRLATLFGFRNLQGLAFQAIFARLSAGNIAQEAFSKLVCRYDELREAAVPILWREYNSEKVAIALPFILKRLVSGELPHSEEMLCKLLDLRPDTPIPAATVASLPPMAASLPPTASADTTGGEAEEAATRGKKGKKKGKGLFSR